MVDDDLRLFARSHRGCARPIHMAQISKRIGRNIDREELFEHLQGASDESHKIMQVYYDVQIDSLIQAAKAMRTGIDSVNPKLQGSFCVCGNTCEGAVEIAKILAGQGNPVIVRVHNGNYTPLGTKGFSDSMCRAATQIAAMGRENVDCFLAESDTCPQNRYSTSAASLHSHYTGSILEGVAGCKHWITRLSSFEPKAGEAYRKSLQNIQNFTKHSQEWYQHSNGSVAEYRLQTVPVCPHHLFRLSNTLTNTMDGATAYLSDWVYQCIFRQRTAG